MPIEELNQIALKKTVSALKATIEQIHQNVGVLGPTSESKQRLSALQQRFLQLRGEHGDLFELLLKMEYAKLLLGALCNLGVRPLECKDIIYKLENLGIFLTKDSQDMRKRRQELRQTIQIVKKELELVAKAAGSNKAQLNLLLLEFHRIYHRLKKRIDSEVVKEEEKKLLLHLQEECTRLREDFKEDYFIQLKIEEAKFLILDLERMRPLPKGFQQLSHTANLFFNTVRTEDNKDDGKNYQNSLAALRLALRKIGKISEIKQEKSKEEKIDGYCTWLFKTCFFKLKEKMAKRKVARTLLKMKMFLLSTKNTKSNELRLKSLEKYMHTLEPHMHYPCIAKIKEIFESSKKSGTVSSRQLKKVSDRIEEAIQKVA